MAIDPRIPMMGEATPFESPFETQSNALALKQAQMATQAAGEDRMLTMLRKGREVLASSYDEPSYQRGLQTLQRLGIPTDDMPKAFDPRYVEQEGRALLDYEQRHKQQLFQDGGDIFGVNPYTGSVNMLRQGPQAPPPAPPAPPTPKPMSEYERESLRLREKELGLRGAKAAATPKVSEGEKVSQRERAKAEAKRPQATQAFRTATREIDNLIADLRTLKADPGVNGITGFVAGRTPGILAASRRAEAMYEKIMAKGQFRALQDLRNASPTGGALGSITDRENEALRASFGALDRKQDAKDFINNIDKVIGDLEYSRGNISSAFADTYGAPESAGATSNADNSATASNLNEQDKQALEWANANPNDPRSAQIKQRLGVK